MCFYGCMSLVFAASRLARRQVWIWLMFLTANMLLRIGYIMDVGGN